MTDSMQDEEYVSDLFDCLASSRRRYVLHRLRKATESPALADLAEDVADRETGTSRSDVADETVKEVYATLYHKHLPKLEDVDLVQYDEERDLVTLSEVPEELSSEDQLFTVM